MGKLDLPFRFRRHAIAGCGTIPPGADSSQYVAITHGARALQNQRAMHAAVGADDEADFDLRYGSGWEKQRIRCGQSLRRPGVFATCARAHVRDVAELGGARGDLPDPVFALGQDGLAGTHRRNRQGSIAGGGNREDQKP